MKYKIKKLKKFIDWYESESEKSRSQIDKRTAKISMHGYFGYWKDLQFGLYELKFSDGRRIYYSLYKISETFYVVLLLGGNKNGQEKDIWKARSLIKKDGSY